MAPMILPQSTEVTVSNVAHRHTEICTPFKIYLFDLPGPQQGVRSDKIG